MQALGDRADATQWSQLHPVSPIGSAGGLGHAGPLAFGGDVDDDADNGAMGLGGADADEDDGQAARSSIIFERTCSHLIFHTSDADDRHASAALDSAFAAGSADPHYRLHTEALQSGTLRFNTIGLPNPAEAQRSLFPINDIRGSAQVADVMNLAAYPGKAMSTYTSDWHPDLNQSAFDKRSLELRMRDRRIKEHGGCAWYSDFLIGNRIGIHNKREYAHDYRHVPKDITW